MRLLLRLLLCLPAFAAAAPSPAALERALRRDWHAAVDSLTAGAGERSAVFILDRGEYALRIRAWLAGHARRSLDVQTFIWADDNVGRLSLQTVLAAARRGVRCRLLVDDLLLDAPHDLLLAADAHPNLSIRVYNPTASVGVGFWRRWSNVLFHFRRVNQRMHHKVLLVDGKAAITGGRNMAGEYYDFNHEFDFRDREALAAGPVLKPMQAAFEEFWNAPQSVPLAALLPGEAAAMGPERAAAVWAVLDAEAADPAHLDPAVAAGIAAVPAAAGDLLRQMDLCPARFVSDHPGKNDGREGLGGGGAATDTLAEALRGARKEVLIQSPYLILDDAALELFKGLVGRGVRVRISTNSAANNDNLQAVAGYQRQRRRLLEAGLEIYEQKPRPANMARRMLRPGGDAGGPIFVIHAKTLVLDRARVFVGTFNLDPRSMNLNTEAGLLLDSPKLAGEAADAIEEDLRPENSWNARVDNGDAAAPRSRRLKLWFWRRLPLEPIL